MSNSTSSSYSSDLFADSSSDESSTSTSPSFISACKDQALADPVCITWSHVVKHGRQVPLPRHGSTSCEPTEATLQGEDWIVVGTRDPSQRKAYDPARKPLYPILKKTAAMGRPDVQKPPADALPASKFANQFDLLSATDENDSSDDDSSCHMPQPVKTAVKSPGKAPAKKVKVEKSKQNKKPVKKLSTMVDDFEIQNNEQAKHATVEAGPKRPKDIDAPDLTPTLPTPRLRGTSSSTHEVPSEISVASDIDDVSKKVLPDSHHAPGQSPKGTQQLHQAYELRIAASGPDEDNPSNDIVVRFPKSIMQENRFVQRLFRKRTVPQDMTGVYKRPCSRAGTRVADPEIYSVLRHINILAHQ